MKKQDKVILDRLLSGKDGLSVQEKEEIWARVRRGMDGPASSRSTSMVRRLAWAGPVLAAAGLLMFLVLPPRDAAERGMFRSRGKPADQGRVSVACITPDSKVKRPSPPSHLLACDQGDRLVFEISAPAGREWFAGGATSDENGEILYFPSERAGPVHAEHGTLVRAAVLLGDEHKPGKYRVVAAFLKESMTAEEWARVLTGTTQIQTDTIVELEVSR